MVKPRFSFTIFDLYCQNKHCPMDSFGEIIKRFRESNGLFLRQVAAKMDIDQAIISKFERGERKPTKEQVQKFARFYKIEEEKLMIAWLSDKVAYELVEEKNHYKILSVAEQKIRFLKIKKKV